MNEEIKQIVRKVERIMAYGKGFNSCANEYAKEGSYIYSKIMSIIIKGVHLYINKEKECVICEYKGSFWNSIKKDGTIDTTNYVPFKGSETHAYCLEHYGFGKNKTINSIDEIIRIVSCYIDKYGSQDGSITRRLNRFLVLAREEGYTRKNKEVCGRLQKLDIPERYKETIENIESCFAQFDSMEKFHPYSYTHGGCYQYARVLELALGVPKLYLNKEMGHCAIVIGDEFLDSEGICHDNKDKFYLFTKDGEKDEYCIEEFGYGEAYKNINKILEVITMYIQKFCPDCEKINVNKRVNNYICLLKEIGYVDETFFKSFNF